jgi:hypothetical protein
VRLFAGKDWKKSQEATFLNPFGIAIAPLERVLHFKDGGWGVGCARKAKPLLLAWSWW